MMVICIEQHLSNNWSSMHEKVKQHWGWVKKALLIKIACNISYSHNTHLPGQSEQ